MKAIRFFPKLSQYKKYIYEEIIKTDVFKYHSFYRNLIDFVIDHRSPLFFEAVESYEYSHFTQYFNFVLLRNSYENGFVKDMFFMHDFVHMIFDNPLNVHDYSFAHFCEITNHNEYVASNETETLTYYRIKELRQRSFPYTIMYDLLQYAGQSVQPSVDFLLRLRKEIVFEEKDGGFTHPDSLKVFSFLRKFKENNTLWNSLWYNSFPTIDFSYSQKRLCLPIATYDRELAVYRSLNSEELYQQNTLFNIRTGLQLLGENDLPCSFNECEEAVKRFDGKIIMESTAKEFNKLYIKNKGT